MDFSKEKFARLPLHLGRTRDLYDRLALGTRHQFLSDRIDDSIDEEEQQTAARNPVIPACPVRTAVCSTEQAVHKSHDIHRKTQVMDEAPGLRTNARADVEAQ